MSNGLMREPEQLHWYSVTYKLVVFFFLLISIPIAVGRIDYKFNICFFFLQAIPILLILVPFFKLDYEDSIKFSLKALPIQRDPNWIILVCILFSLAVQFHIDHLQIPENFIWKLEFKLLLCAEQFPLVNMHMRIVPIIRYINFSVIFSRRN